MKSSSKLLSLLLAVIILLAISLTGCSTSDDGGDPIPTPTPTPFPTGSGIVTAKVMDESGKAIVGANVEIQDASNPGASSLTKENPATTTDGNGQFTFTDLATGVKYLIIITYEGKVTLQPIIVISEDTQFLSFEITMPVGEGVATFDLPVPSVLNTPVRSGRTVTLTWSLKDKAPVFQGFYLYRSTVAGVTPNDTLLTANALYGVNTYTDTLPTGGTYFYRLFESYILSEYSVRIVLSSNEVYTSPETYVFSQKWISSYEDEAIMEYPFGLALWMSGTNRTLFITDMVGMYYDPKYMFKIVNDGLLTPFYYQDIPVALTRVLNGGYYGVRGIALDAQGRGYLTGSDGYSGFLVIGDQSGNLIDMMTTYWYEDWTNVAVVDQPDGSKLIYITDPEEWDIEVYYWEEGWGFENLQEIWFDDVPYGLAVDAEGNFYVSFLAYEDRTAGYVTKFDSNFNEIMTITGSGETGGSFTYPLAVTVDGSGNIYVADTNNFYYYGPQGAESILANPVTRVMKFDAQGGFITQFGQYGEPTIPEGLERGIYIGTTPDGTFVAPTGLAVDPDQNVYVADPWSMTVQKFILVK
jgi:sugar lactone lactonase YvrE